MEEGSVARKHDISHHLENNHEVLSEWLYSKLNGVERAYNGQGRHGFELAL